MHTTDTDTLTDAAQADYLDAEEAYLDAEEAELIRAEEDYLDAEEAELIRAEAADWAAKIAAYDAAERETWAEWNATFEAHGFEPEARPDLYREVGCCIELTSEGVAEVEAAGYRVDVDAYGCAYVARR